MGLVLCGSQPSADELDRPSHNGGLKRRGSQTRLFHFSFISFLKGPLGKFSLRRELIDTMVTENFGVFPCIKLQCHCPPPSPVLLCELCINYYKIIHTPQGNICCGVRKLAGGRFLGQIIFKNTEQSLSPHLTILPTEEF